MRFRALIVLALAGALVSLGACSHGENPSLPGTPGSAETTHSSTTDAAFHPGHNLLGYWNITVDTNAGTVHAAPLRQTDTHINVLTWLENGPCTDCLQITNFEQDIDENLLIDITLTHPYATQPKFTGFDVRGICMFGGYVEFPEFDLKASSLLQKNPQLLNPDGFTTLYEPATTSSGPLHGYFKGKMAPDFAWPNASVNGYKYFCDSIPDPLDLPDPAEVLDPTYIQDRGAFRAGEINTRRFKIKTPIPIFTFGYAVDANWAKPSEPYNVPDSWPLTANCPEVYLVETELSSPLPMSPGATTDLTIDVYDWQGAGTIVSLFIEGPNIWGGLIEAQLDSGGPATQRFTAELVNEFGFLPSGDYPILIRILDTESSPGAVIDNTGWKYLEIPIVQNHPPNCAAEVSIPEPGVGETITFTDTSTDPQGPGDLNESWWAWDWENDQTWIEEGFEVDHSFDTPGIYLVNHKVIDNSGAEDTLDEPLELDVGMFITLQEDLDSKEIDRQYKYLTLDAAYGGGSIIDITDLDGPWDFTTIGLANPQSVVTIIDDSDSEVSGFVDDFNANTTHFVKYSGFYDLFLPVIYQAEYHYFTSDKLYIYGFHSPYLIGSAPLGPPDYDDLIIPFPLYEDTDYSYEINIPGFFLLYGVTAIGEGTVTVPYDGDTVYDCLLVRYKFRVDAGGPVKGDTINFAFISDEGATVANVIAVNYPPTYNWIPASNHITGDAQFQALNEIL